VCGLAHCRIFSRAQRLIISLTDLSLRSDIVDPRRLSAPAYDLSSISMCQEDQSVMA
jgi:hypothetical protein